MTQAVDAGDKVILFLNRRGYASLLACSHCGHTWVCPHCDVALAYFARGDRLRCRICDYQRVGAGGVPGLPEHGAGASTATAPRPSSARCAGLLPGIELLRLDSDVAGSFARLSRRARALRRAGQQGAGGHADDRQGPPLSRRHPGRAWSTPTSRCASPTSAPRSAPSPCSCRWAVAAAAASSPAACWCRPSIPRRGPSPWRPSGEHERFYDDEARPARGARLPAVEHAAGRRGVVDRRRQGDRRRGLRGHPPARRPAPRRARASGRGRCRANGPATWPAWWSRAPPSTRPCRSCGQLLARYGARFARRGARLVVDVEPQWL